MIYQEINDKLRFDPLRVSLILYEILETITCFFVHVSSPLDSAGFFLHDKAPNAFSFGATVNAFEKDDAEWPCCEGWRCG